MYFTFNQGVRRLLTFLICDGLGMRASSEDSADSTAKDDTPVTAAPSVASAAELGAAAGSCEALTPAEQALLRRYQQLDVAPRRYVHHLVLELLPPLAFVGLWAWTGHVVFLLALIAVQVSFGIARVVRQRGTVVALQGIATKTLAQQAGGDAPQGPAS